MVSKIFTIISSDGLHMRTAGVLASEMGKFPCDVDIIHNGTTFNAKSLMNVLTACIKCGDDIEIRCSGDDEQEALSCAENLIESNFIM